MNCFRNGWRRTSPMPASSRNELVSSKPPRRNGWSWPPQVFQVIGWLVYSYLAIVSFGIYIPLLPLPWNYVLYSVSLSHSCNLAVVVSAAVGPFRFEYGASISLCFGLFAMLVTRQGFCCVLSVWAPVTPDVTLSLPLRSLWSPKDIITGVFVTCWNCMMSAHYFL